LPGIIYTLNVSGISDVNGNAMSAQSVQFMVPDTIRSNDIVINEVLFNPFTGGVDFVELYNRSSKALDLINLRIANTDDAGSTDDVEDITGTSDIMLPGTYRVVTEVPEIVRGTYTSGPVSDFIAIGNLPSYNDSEGGVVLLDVNGAEIDRFIYNEDFHFPLLDDQDGISLERLDPDRSSADSTNWHSAAASVGFATPALKNSQFSQSSSDGSEITVTPEVFSPDNDGHEDVLNIHYQFGKPGYTASVKIFSANGRPVISLVQSDLLGTEEGVWSWDGIDENNEKAPVGIYVLFIEAFEKGGSTKQIRKTCVLGAKL
jgi:hypothetical protein